MKIVVCIKQVVDTDDIRWTKNNTIDREGVQSVVNPCDLLALETSLRIKSQCAEPTTITVLTMGPQQAADALRTAIAMGCDEAFLLSDKRFSGADTVATSKTLAKAIEHICPDFDLILCGQFASDGDTAQTGPSIAQKLNVEQITYATEFAGFSENLNKINFLRKSDDAIEVIETPLPALVCIAECPYAVSQIKIAGYIKAQDYNIKTLNADDLGLLRDEVGIKGSPTWVSKAFRAVSNRSQTISKCDVFEVVKQLDEAVLNSKNKQKIDNFEYDNNCCITDEIVNFSKKIVVWGELDKEGNLRPVVFQLATKGAELAKMLENCGVCVLVPKDIDEFAIKKLANYGANEIVIMNSSSFEVYNTKNYANGVLQFLQSIKEQAEIFLIGATKQGRDLAPQVSSALATGLTADCTGLDILDGKLAATRPTFGGELMATIMCKTLPQMATVRPGVFIENNQNAVMSISKRIFEVMDFELSQKKILKTYDFELDKNALEGASIVVAGGRGLKDAKTFAKLEELAQLLGAQLGATRKAVDAGLASHSIQIGQTGKTIAPDLYIAFGISGAIQHCVGISQSKSIIAVNNNENAPITKHADITFIVDAVSVIDNWIEYLKNKQ